MKLFHISDIHFGREDENALAQVETQFRLHKPAALVVSGDVSQRGKRSEFRAARRWLDKFNAPRIVVPGNHDTPLLHLPARIVAPFDRFDEYFLKFRDALSLSGTYISGLNTARGWQARRNWAEGSVNLEDLDAEISRVEDQTSTLNFLTCHHPFEPHPDAPLQTRTSRGSRASEALAKSRFGFLLVGHVHKPSVNKVVHGECSYISLCAGTLSNRLRDMKPSFNLIEITEDHVDARAILIGPGQQTSVMKLGRWAR